MNTKNWIRFLLVMLLLGIFTYVIWGTITYAESKEIINKKSYIESMKAQEEQMKQLWDEENTRCTENLDYYHSQAIYLRATIEQEEANLTEMLGLKKRS